MTELTLIRHGQANTGATDEASYDRLSDLGHLQARFLGEHMRGLGLSPRVVSGTMRRHIETAQGMALSDAPLTTDPRLNELDYFALSHAARDNHGVPFPQSQADFAMQMPQVLDIWRRNEMPDDIETYDAFRDRILSAMTDAAKDGPAVLVSSGGVIATLTAIALHLETDQKTKMLLTIHNTSVHKFELRGDELYLTQFGATPHLDMPDRHHMKTHI
jgi:broad specificity phosphatase PhoE